MLDQAAEHLRDVGCHVELRQGTATSTGLERDRFDAVRTERVLMHVADPVAALAELARVTRPGGRIVLVEPDHRRLAVDTDLPDVWVRYVTAFSRLLANTITGLRVPADATAFGPQVTTNEPMPFQFGSFADFRQVFDLEVGRQPQREDGIPEGGLNTLLDDLEQRHVRGRFFAVGTMYVVAAEKAVPWR